MNVRFRVLVSEQLFGSNSCLCPSFPPTSYQKTEGRWKEEDLSYFILRRTQHEISRLNKFWSHIIVEYRYNIVQQISRICSSYLTKTLCLSINIFLEPPPSQPLITTIPIFDFVNLTILGISYKWNHVVFKIKWYSVVCIYHILSIHSSVNEYLGCFHIWLL